MRLCCEIQDLAVFNGEKLQWATGLTSASLWRRLNTSESQLGFVSLQDCTANWPAVFLANVAAPRLSRGDCALIGAAARVVEESGGVDLSCYVTPPELLKGSDDKFRGYSSVFIGLANLVFIIS